MYVWLWGLLLSEILLLLLLLLLWLWLWLEQPSKSKRVKGTAEEGKTQQHTVCSVCTGAYAVQFSSRKRERERKKEGEKVCDRSFSLSFSLSLCLSQSLCLWDQSVSSVVVRPSESPRPSPKSSSSSSSVCVENTFATFIKFKYRRIKTTRPKKSPQVLNTHTYTLLFNCQHPALNHPYLLNEVSLLFVLLLSLGSGSCVLRKNPFLLLLAFKLMIVTGK